MALSIPRKYWYSKGLGGIPHFQTPEDKEKIDAIKKSEILHEQFFDDIIDNKNLIFQIALLGAAIRLAKMPDGMKTLQVLGKATLEGLFKTLSYLGKASAANHVAAWANPVLISGVLERFGMLPPDFNDGFHKGITVISGVDLIGDIIEAILDKKGGFPSTLDFGSEQGAEAGAAEAAAPAAGAPPIV